MVLGLLDQLLIFSQLYLIELLGLLAGLELLQLWHLIYPRILTGFGMLVFFTNLCKFYGTSGQAFGCISSFLRNRQFQMVHGKSSQEVAQSSILRPTLFLLYINDLPDNVICDAAIFADSNTFNSKCDQESNLWQQLALVSELESYLQDPGHLGKKWLVDFSAEKTQLVLFDRCIITMVLLM